MLKIVSTVLILSLLLCGCNKTPPENIDESNVSDTMDAIQIKDMDSYVENLYDDLFGYYKNDLEDGLFHNHNAVTVDDISVEQICRVAYYSDIEVIEYNKDGYEGYYWSYKDLTSAVTRLFGDSVTVKKDSWSGGGKVWVYNEAIDAFLGDAAYGGEERKRFDCRYYGKYEVDGEYLYVYDNCYYCEYDNESGLTFFYNDIDKTEESLFLKWDTGNLYDNFHIDDEIIQEYGAEYKHTFKLTEDGSNYYWISSEPVR